MTTTLGDHVRELIGLLDQLHRRHVDIQQRRWLRQCRHELGRVGPDDSDDPVKWVDRLAALTNRQSDCCAAVAAAAREVARSLGGRGAPDLPARLLRLAVAAGDVPMTGDSAPVLAARPELVGDLEAIVLEPAAEATAAGLAGERKTKGKNIDARMLKVMAEVPECLDWSSDAWAAHLSCGESTVRETNTWKVLLPNARGMRAAAGAARMDPTRTSPKGRRVRKKPG